MSLCELQYLVFVQEQCFTLVRVQSLVTFFSTLKGRTPPIHICTLDAESICSIVQISSLLSFFYIYSETCLQDHLRNRDNLRGGYMSL